MKIICCKDYLAKLPDHSDGTIGTTTITTTEINFHAITIDINNEIYLDSSNPSYSMLPTFTDNKLNRLLY